jgi:hypothetical protein
MARAAINATAQTLIAPVMNSPSIFLMGLGFTLS